MLDLVIVANFYQMGKGFTENTERYGALSIVIYYAQFAPQYDRWVDATILLNKFDTGNAYSMWSLFVFTLINRSIPLLNDSDNDSDMKPFAFCMILSIMGAMVFNFCVAWQVPCTRVSTMTTNAVSCVYLFLWAVVWLSSFHMAVAAWIVYLVLPTRSLYMFCSPLVETYVGVPEGGRATRIAMDVELMTERLGLLIVLALGEVLMTTVKAGLPRVEAALAIVPPEFVHWRPLLSTALTIGLAGHTKLAYFDTYGCPGEESSGVEKHAFKASISSSLFYLRFHMIAVMSIVLSAGMMEITNEEYESGKGGELSLDSRLISGLAFAGINGSFGILREQHQYKQSTLNCEMICRRNRVYVLVAVCTAQVLGAVLVPFSDPLMLQFMGQALFAGNIFFEECCQGLWSGWEDKEGDLKHRHAVFTDHHGQESHCSTSVGGLTHITTFSPGASGKGVPSETDPLISDPRH